MTKVRVEKARDAALDPEGSQGGPGASDLPGLLAYEARIENVSEWPFDTPTLLRFGMLMIIALGSWVGGAIVERAPRAVLG